MIFNKLIQPARTWFGRRRRRPLDDAGIMSIEFAFMVPVLVMRAMGGLDLGRYALDLSTVASAARAGAQYGVQDQATAVQPLQMIAAARNDAADTTGALDISARQYCRCPGGGGEVPCGGTCADGGFPQMYVEVIVADNLDLWFPYYPGISDPATLTASHTIRVR